MLEENKIFDEYDQRFGKISYIFQKDGASSHRAKKTQKFLDSKTKYLKDDLKCPANSPDLNVIEMLWAIIKAKLIIDEITTPEQLFEKIQKIWDEIPISTINLLIQSFDSRIKTCIALHGESINGKKKIRKLFKESYQQGNEYNQRKNEENKQKELFIYQSNCFFFRLSLLDFGKQCNRLNCNNSTQICNILPQRFLNKVKMPKPTVVQGGIIYLPK